MSSQDRRLPKEWRAIVDELVGNQGWRYKAADKGSHATLYPADRTQQPIVIAGSPSDHRAIKNFTAHVRRAGGVWPPAGRN